MHGPTSIVLVTRNFPPLVGGMENVNSRLLRELSRKWGVALCGPGDSRVFAPDATEVRESPLNPLGLFLASTLMRAIGMTRRLRPRMVIAGSGLTLPIAWCVARMTGARLGVYLHGLDIIAPSMVYQLFWPPFIRRCDLVLVNSNSTARLAIAKEVAQSRIHVLHPGTSIPDLDLQARGRFRESLGLPTQPILLSVGRLTRRKGLAEFVTNALPAILKEFPTTQLVVVGDEAKNALTGDGKSERDRILTAARGSGSSHAVRFIGQLDDASLRDAYLGADLHVFPVLQTAGDIEGFGMVALEAAAHGLRTVAFDVGGVPDAVQVPTTGSLAPAGDYLQFSDAVVKSLRSSAVDADQCRAFARAKSWDVFGERVRKLVAAEIGDG